MNTQALWNRFARLFNLAPQRRLPKFQDRGSGIGDQETGGRELVPCLLLSDAFSEHFYPHRLDVAVDVLARAGYRAEILPVIGAGRTLISKGFRRAAKRHARKLVAAINKLDPEGSIPIVGLEPSEIYTLRDEYPDFFPGDESVARMAERAWMIDEFLVRDDRLETYLTNLQNANIPITDLPTANVLLHGHCYQKARPPADDGEPVGVDASVTLLETLGYSVEVVDSGCCGMAGAFGYETEHYDLSMHVGEVALFPAVRAADADAIVAASGVSCQSQIEDGAGRKAVHPVELIAHKVRILEEQDEEKSQVAQA
jgi:Fe-S oxidoreductase